MGSFISDGYTRADGYIAAAKPAANGEVAHDALAFSYRVATRAEMVQLDARINFIERKINLAATADEAASHSMEMEKLTNDFIAKHVTDWNLVDSGGTAVAFTGPNVMNVHYQLTYRLYSIIRGLQTSDSIPNVDENDPKMPPDSEMVKN